MKTVEKMLKSTKHMDFREGLNYAIKRRKFLIHRKIDDTSVDKAGDDDGEHSDTSNGSKTY